MAFAKPKAKQMTDEDAALHKLTFRFHRREIQTVLPFALRVSTSQHGGVASLKMTAEGAFSIAFFNESSRKPTPTNTP